MYNPDAEWQDLDCVESNKELLASLREDRNAAKLHQLTMKDYELGRMSKPQPSSAVDLSRVRFISCTWALHTLTHCATPDPLGAALRC